MYNHRMKKEVIELSKQLRRLHKDLLDFQVLIHQDLTGKKLGPYEILHLSIQDPEFAWLRKLSEMIVAIDIQEEENSNLQKSDFDKIKAEVNHLLFSENELNHDFQFRYQNALGKKPELSIHQAQLMKSLSLFG